MMVLHVALCTKEKTKQSPTKNNTNSIVTMNLLGKDETNLNLKAKTRDEIKSQIQNNTQEKKKRDPN